MTIKKYDVYVLNDETTTVSQALQIVMHVFGKDMSEAQRIVDEVHNDGQAHVGTYIQEVAESKVNEVGELSRLNNLEFQAYIEYDNDYHSELEDQTGDFEVMGMHEITSPEEIDQLGDLLGWDEEQREYVKAQIKRALDGDKD